MIEWLLVLAVIALVAANGVFVAAEFGFVAVDRAAIEQQARSGDRRARGLVTALRSLSTQLSGAQLGITVTSLVVGYIAEPSLAALLRVPLQATGLGALTLPVSIALAFAAATTFQMVFGELAPKNLAIARPQQVARAVAPAQRGFTALAGPLIKLLNGSANYVLGLLGVPPQEELASARSPQELQSLVLRSGQMGTLDPPRARLVTRSLEFRTRTAADAMTPRRAVRAVGLNAPVSEVVELARSSGLSRFPVFGDSIDDPAGLVHLKQAVVVPIEQRGERRVREVMSPALIVPASAELDELLVRMRQQGRQLAVVADEYGGTAGVLTLEDLVEEIVGDIRDEHDPRSVPARRDDDGTWVLSGLLRPDEATAVTGIAVPEHPDYDTLGGLINDVLGRIPEEGDTAVIQEGEFQVTLTVVRMDGLRVDRLRLCRGKGSPGTLGDRR